jgi:hypothetical protein
MGSAYFQAQRASRTCIEVTMHPVFTLAWVYHLGRPGREKAALLAFFRRRAEARRAGQD